MAGCIRQVSLIVNCGYARVSIYENSSPNRRGRYARQNIDIITRENNFKSQFSAYPSYRLPAGYFDKTGKENYSQFFRDCNKILNGFSLKFRSDCGYSRESYLDTFSSEKWSTLPNIEKKQHSMSNCSRCFELHKEHQIYFPLKPYFQPKPVITIDREAFQQQGIKTFTSNVFSDLNRAYQNESSTSFSEAIVQNKSLGLQEKKNRAEKRKERRDLEKKITKTITERFAQSAAVSMLAEGESKQKYHRKRLAQSYCTPEEPKSKKKKTHSPDFNKVSWDTQELEATIQNWPEGTTINWTTIAKEHGITGGNAGQIVKEFAEARQIDLSHINTPKRKPTKRPCKKKLPNFGIAIPSNPPLAKIESEIDSMIKSGRFNLGVECAPHKVTRYVQVNSTLSPQETIIYGRKVPLQQIRQDLLNKHLKYMRLTPTSTVTGMTTAELTDKLKRLDYLTLNGASHDALCQHLIKSERSRFLCMWHDHATILKTGFIMITVHVMYDPMVFYTDEEYLDLPHPVKTDTGILVQDTLRFFTGDHPATQFEQGTKQGGMYKCGACGCQESLFGDQAHSLTHPWRPLKEIQSLATGGIFGKSAARVLHPFDHLRVSDLKKRA